MTRPAFDIPERFTVCPDCHERDGRHFQGCPSDPLGSEYTPEEADRLRSEYEKQERAVAKRQADRIAFARAWNEANAKLHTPEPTDEVGRLNRALELAVEAHTRRVQALVDGTASEQAGWGRLLVERVQAYHALLTNASDEGRRAHRREQVQEEFQHVQMSA